MHEEIDVAAFGFNEAAGRFDFVFGGIGLGAKFGDDFAVDADLTGKDELLGVAARSDAGMGDDFLKAFEHEESNPLSVHSHQLPGKARRRMIGCVEDYTSEGGWG